MARPRSGGNALYVVASNCPARLKSGGDFYCDGTADEVEIAAALASLTSQRGGVVRLSPGVFSISSTIDLRQGQKVWGSGMTSTLLNATITGAAPFDMFRFTVPPAFEATATGGSASTVTFAGDVTGSIAVGSVLRIKRGTGAGQKRTVLSRAHAGGTTTVTISEPDTGTPPIEKYAWHTNPSSDSVFVIDPAVELFAGLGHFTADGRRKTSALPTGNAAHYGTMKTGLADYVNARVVDNSGTAFPSWCVGMSVYIYRGTGAGQMRRIEARSTTNSTNDTILLDGPWWPALDATSLYVIGGHGLACYGATCFDLMLTDLWFTQFTGCGVYTEQGWGMLINNLISEYNDLDGFHIQQPPAYAAIGNLTPRPYQGEAWGTGTTGQVAVSAPKINNSKIVWNGSSDARGGSGIRMVGRVHDAVIVGNEIGTQCAGGPAGAATSDRAEHGIHLEDAYGAGPRGATIVGNAFTSFGNLGTGQARSAAVCFDINAQNHIVVGNRIKLADSAYLRHAALVPDSGGYYNLVANNVVVPDSTNCVLFYDRTGWNMYRNNLVPNSYAQDHFEGIVSAAADGAGGVSLTFPAALNAAALATDLIATFCPKDATTAAVAGWYVSALSNTAITITSASATPTTTYSFYVRVIHESRRTGNA